ncbi:MAG: 3-hydroxyacyl-[acyl-carrier-protein] dehydratase FabA, partial [SAR324 cluster bacterium]|nr:3-hydroxyacyl-[acyl-carrier-protein] dehydratase FabA [SAR324 cluster bacterium]
ALYYSPVKGEKDKYYSVRGGYIQDFSFDPTLFDLPAAELESLDNIYQWSLYVARESLKDAGYLQNSAACSGCGVIMGNLSFPTRTSNRLSLPIYYRAIENAVRELTGLDGLNLADGSAYAQADFVNSRISGYPAALVTKTLSLSGPYFSIDAACASSLYAVKIACDYLQNGKADMMLAGAVSAGDPFFVNMGFSTFTAYSEKDQSRPLDRNSGGLVSGEGAGMLVLKRFDDALKDNDRIYATIGGIGLSNDGRGKSVLSPSAQGQVLAYERAYADALVKPDAVSYIECHATGTPVGDIEEVASLEQFFGRHHARPLIGSVKANFGHLLTAAGMASMIKVILSMTERQIPATINLIEPVQTAAAIITAQQIVSQNTPWPGQSEVNYGAVNAFGFGGTNAHMVFEKQDQKQLEKARKTVLNRKQRQKKETLPSLAIVGMEAHFGSSNGLDAFDYALYSQKQQFKALPAKRWKGIENQAELLADFGFKEGKPPRGSFIEDFSLDVLRYKIPPNEVESMIPQQLLMMGVADKAILDANIKEGANVAVLIAMESDPTLHQFRGRIDLGLKMEQALASVRNELDETQVSDLQKTLKDVIRKPVQVNEFSSFIGNIMASRIASLWDFSGPAFTVSSEENSVFKALEVAQMLLAAGEVEAVVVPLAASLAAAVVDL